MVFGSIQTGTTVLATDAGQAGIAGLVHASLGVGSVIAGLAVAALPARFGYASRVLVAALGSGRAVAAAARHRHHPAAVRRVLVLGFVVAPYMISVFMLGERAAPASRVGAAMTLLAGATGIGYAVGSAVAGRLADVHGHTGAFAVTVAAAMSAAVLAAASQPLLRRLGRSPPAAEPRSDAAAHRRRSTLSTSPTWHCSTSQIAVMVLNRTALARLFLSTERFTTVTPTASARAASVMPRSSSSRSR